MPPFPCQPTWSCTNDYDCGPGPQALFICGGEFEGCERTVSCSGKFVKCEDGDCLNQQNRFVCRSFSCGASGSSIFSCRRTGRKLECLNSGKSFDCHHEYYCENGVARKYNCGAKFICADLFDCDQPNGHDCPDFLCGTGQQLDRFTCAVFTAPCPTYQCLNF